MAVYDPEDQEKQALSPAELSSKEAELGKSYDDSSRRYRSDMRGDKQRDLREQSQAQDQEERKSLEDRLRDAYQDVRDQDNPKKSKGDSKDKEDDSNNNLYNPNDKGRGIRAKISGLSGRKKGLMVGAGGGVIGLVLALGGIFGFLNSFKLDHLITNLDATAFARVNSMFDRRSSKWVAAYVNIRLDELAGGLDRLPDGSINFASGRVDTNRPFTDWYRTLRSNNFEQRMFNDRGIYFSSNVTPDGRARFVRVQVGQSIIDSPTFDSSLNAAGRRQLISQNLDNLTMDIFEGPGASKQMRRQLRSDLKNDTRFYQVMKRRHIRKDIQNKIGVRDWRFFEVTRERAADKRREFKNKMLTRVIPESTKSGTFLLCVFGLGACQSTADPASPENRMGGGARGSPLDEGDAVSRPDADGNEVIDNSRRGSAQPDADRAILEASEEAARAAGDIADDLPGRKFRSAFMKKILSKVVGTINVINVVDTMDMLLRIHKNILGGKLSHMVIAARAAQALAAYTTYGIMRDQLKTGDVTPEELGYAMEGLNGIANSEGYDFFFKTSGQSTVSAMADRETFCRDDYVKQPGDYYFLCDDIKIGGSSRASSLEETYRSSPAFAAFRLAMEGYREARDSFIGRIVGGFANWLMERFSDVISFVLSPILGLFADQMEALVAWLGDKITVALGAGPILTGDPDVDPPGLTMNMIGQGAAYAAELNTRMSGAAIETEDTRIYTNKITAQYLADEEASKSLYERYFALDNPKSIAATTLFSATNTSFNNVFTNVGQVFRNGFAALFSPRALAAADSFGAAEFAGLETYAFPPVCIENDPLTVMPLEMTNADDLGLIPADDIDWALLGNEEAFWRKVYEGLDEDNQDIALKVYNCELLDKRIRGGLGYTSGYINDGGLEDGGAAITSPGGLIAGEDIEGQNTANMQCPNSPTVQDAGVENEAYKNGVRYSIRLCSVHGVRINAIAAANYDALFTAMASRGYTVRGSGGFRDMAGQISGWNGGRGSGTHARPGYSNHQFGIAVDISCQGGGASYQQGTGRGREGFLQNVASYPCLNYVFQNSSQYGLLLQCQGQGNGGAEIRATSGGCEWWHISPTGG